jgi:hypothetical protein
MEARTQYQTIEAKEVIDGRHPPVIFPVIAKSEQGIIPAGCVLAKDSDGKVVPYAVVSDEEMTGLVNDANKVFTHTSEAAPLQPGSVKVTHGLVELADNGHGVIAGTGGSGTVDYETGAISVSFQSAPAADSGSPEVEVARAVFAVAIRPTDTSREDIVSAIVHGTVLKTALVIGIAAGAITQAAVDALAKIGIYATL